MGRTAGQKPRCLDLFCGAGGATRGLQQAGFHVVGVDIKPQPRYVGDEFHQADAMTFPLEGFDFIWASPPCQGYSHTARLWVANRPKLIEGTRRRVRRAGVHWCIENVPGSPLRLPVVLCGAMFGLRTYRHRYFETSAKLSAPAHPKHIRPTAKMGRPVGVRQMISVVGNFSGARMAKAAMGIDWMTREQLAEAVPPAYSKYIGEQMMPHVLRSMSQKEAPCL